MSVYLSTVLAFTGAYLAIQFIPCTYAWLATPFGILFKTLQDNIQQKKSCDKLEILYFVIN